MTAAEINGLEVILEYPCRRCRSTAAIVAAGTGPHAAALECASCGRFQQWLARECCGFLTEVVARFGRPTEPIRIFEQVHGGRVAHDRRHQTSAPESEDNNMDMRQFSGETFIKLDDVRGNPLLQKIAEIKTGKFEKPNLVFESGEALSLNATNNRVLIRNFGPDSDAWIGKEVELYAGQVEFQGKPLDAVLVRPISPTPKPSKKPAPKPADMNDEVPF
jgi:hypothetical protein